MIKINLLIGRKEKKGAGIRKEFIILALSIVLLGMGLMMVQWRMNRQKDEVQAKIAETKKEIAYHKSLLTEVNKAKEAQKSLQDKLDVINALRKEKTSPARVLEVLSVQKPDKIQLDSMKKEGLKLGIEGIALDNETIAHFMTSLRNSKMFKNVDLIVSEQSEQSRLKLKKFTLSCEIILL